MQEAFYLSRFLVDDPEFKVIADDVFIKCNDELGSLGRGETV